MLTVKRLCAIMAVATIVACAPATIRLRTLQPAVSDRAWSLRHVAVLPFGGDIGPQITAAVESLLAGIMDNDKPRFVLSNRMRLGNGGGGLGHGRTLLVSPQEASGMGRQLGAAGVYAGMATSSMEDSLYSEARKTCREWKNGVAQSGATQEAACVEWNVFSVACIRRVVTVTAAIRIVKVENDEVVYSRQFVAAQRDHACSDAGPVDDADHLMRKAIETIIGELRKDIAPYYTYTDVTLLGDTQNIAAKETKDALKRGIDFAKNGRLEAACEIWQTALAAAPTSPTLSYNLGICEESGGEPGKALLLYRKAEQYLGQPHEVVTRAIHRAQQAVEKTEMLQKQLQQDD